MGAHAHNLPLRALGEDAKSGALITPGDYVDVVATMPTGNGTTAELQSIVLLQRILVLAVGLDTTAPLALGQRVQALKPIQGALDPLLLRAGGEALDARVEEYLVGAQMLAKQLFQCRENLRIL